MSELHPKKKKKKLPIQIKNIHPILISLRSWQPTGLKPNKKAEISPK